MTCSTSVATGTIIPLGIAVPNSPAPIIGVNPSIIASQPRMPRTTPRRRCPPKRNPVKTSASRQCRSLSRPMAKWAAQPGDAPSAHLFRKHRDNVEVGHQPHHAFQYHQQ